MKTATTSATSSATTTATAAQRATVVVLAASLASTIGGLPFNALPVMLGSMADSFGLQAQAVGLIGSVCFAGYLAGTLAAPLWIDRAHWRWLTLVSALATMAAFALSSRVQDVNTLYGIWALIGFLRPP
jgi:MFS family permease